MNPIKNSLSPREAYGDYDADESKDTEASREESLPARIADDRLNPELSDSSPESLQRRSSLLASEDSPVSALPFWGIVSGGKNLAGQVLTQGLNLLSGSFYSSSRDSERAENARLKLSENQDFFVMRKEWDMMLSPAKEPDLDSAGGDSEYLAPTLEKIHEETGSPKEILGRAVGFVNNAGKNKLFYNIHTDIHEKCRMIVNPQIDSSSWKVQKKPDGEENDYVVVFHISGRLQSESDHCNPQVIGGFRAELTVDLTENKVHATYDVELLKEKIVLDKDRLEEIKQRMDKKKREIAELMDLIQFQRTFAEPAYRNIAEFFLELPENQDEVKAALREKINEIREKVAQVNNSDDSDEDKKAKRVVLEKEILANLTKLERYNKEAWELEIEVSKKAWQNARNGAGDFTMHNEAIERSLAEIGSLSREEQKLFPNKPRQ
ncbi:MAG: hypothetical protein WB791_01280 [Waddliaceae bacterium]